MAAKPRLRMLFKHCVRRAASRALCTAGEINETKTAMIEITTNSSIKVKPKRLLGCRPFGDCVRRDFMLLLRSTWGVFVLSIAPRFISKRGPV